MKIFTSQTLPLKEIKFPKKSLHSQTYNSTWHMNCHFLNVLTLLFVSDSVLIHFVNGNKIYLNFESSKIRKFNFSFLFLLSSNRKFSNHLKSFDAVLNDLYALCFNLETTILHF